MLQSNYKIPATQGGPEETNRIYKYTDKRIGRVSRYLYGDEDEICELLPHKGDFPIVPQIYNTGFINGAKRSIIFDELLDSTKNLVFKAERIMYFDTLFKNYLSHHNISIDSFKKNSPTERKNIIEAWMNENRIPEGIIDL